MKLTKLNDLTKDGEVVKGDWEITPNHEIRYKSKKKDEEFKFKGSLVAAEPDALVVSVTQRQSDQKVVTKIVKLAGAWRMDAKNRIVFEVERQGGKNDVLTLKGAWRLGEANELIYAYRQTDIRRKRKTVRRITRELAFAGFWDISDDNRLTYRLGADSDSAFRVRGAFQTKSIFAKQNEIRYQVGVEVNGKHKIQDIILFGKWKVSRTLGLSFEITYENNRKKSINFVGEYALSGDSQIAVNLKNRSGKPLGVELLLTKDLFGKDGQAFVRLERTLEDSRVEVGMRLRW